MAEVSATPSMWESAGLRPGRRGAMEGAPGLIVQERRVASFALITARAGQRDALAQAMRSVFGLEPPAVGRRITTERLALTGVGPARWLAEALEPSPESIERRLLDALGASTAAVVDQSDAYAVLCVQGPRVRDVLAAGLPVDLHPRAFAVGDAAQTLCAHIGVLVWRRADEDGAPVFELATPRSTFASFWHWLETSALRHGLEVRAAT